MDSGHRRSLDDVIAGGPAVLGMCFSLAEKELGAL